MSEIIPGMKNIHKKILAQAFALLMVIALLTLPAYASFLPKTPKIPIRKFTPESISQLNSWFDTDTLENIPDGEQVSSWTSRVNGTTFTQSDSKVQPRRYNQVIGFEQPHSALQFDLGNYLDGLININQQSTIIMVTKSGDPAGYTTQYYLDGTDSQNRFGVYKNDSDLSAFGTSNITETAHDYGRDEIFTVIYNGDKSALYSNGSLVASGSLGSNNITSLRLGNSYDESLGFYGYIGDIIIYDKVLTNEERQNVEQYLKVKYDVQAAL